MSHPWNRSVRLRVEPGLVRGVLEPSWIQARLAAAYGAAANEARARLADFKATPADPSIDALAQAIDTVLLGLAATAPLHGARLEVELADSLAHLDVVSGDFVGNSERQLQSVAAACVAELLGDAAQDHEVRWQLQADEKHLLIGAIARDRLDSFAIAATRHRLTLGRVQPDFCLQWNRYAATLEPGATVFAVASGREAVIAAVADGAITAFSSGAWLDRTGSAGALDIRADRLLSSIGQGAANQAAYLLVAPAGADKAVSARWTVLNRKVPVR